MLKMRFDRLAASSLLTILFIGSASPPPAGAQQPAGADPTLTTTSQEVLLDVVVRDKRGRAIKDLKSSDFEITDAGAAQTIKAFRLVSGAEASPAPAAPSAGRPAEPASAAVDPLRQIRLVTLAFERLGPDARVTATKAVEELLNADNSPNLLFAVFSIDQRLSILQQYTNDRDRIRKAVARVVSSSSSLYKSESDQIEEELKVESTMAQAGAAIPTNANGAPDGGAAASAAMAQMTLNMLQLNQTLDRTQAGRSTIYALKALIQEQYRLPGRKTVLYFTEGMYVPPDYKNDLDNIIGAANRFNVSVYGIDARGLTTFSQNGAGGSLLSQSVSSSRTMQTQRTGPVTRDQATAGDRSEESIRANSQNSLAELSEHTGGFLIANSNDLKGQLRRVAEDIDTHYEISYTPAIEKFDGSFRKILVKVDRADARIQTRSGYYALPYSQGRAVSPWEMSMMSAINATPLPKAIPFRASSVRFQESNGASEGSVVIEVPLEGIQFDRDEAAKAYRVHFSVMAIFRNQQGAIERRVSQDVPRQGPIDRIDGFRAGRFIYTQKVSLPPGRYTLETAVFDTNSGKAGVKKAAVIVPPPSKGPAMSGISLVRSVAPPPALPAQPDSSDPFVFDGGKVTPALDDTVKREAGGALSFYFTVYPAPGAKSDPALTLEFLQDDKVVARAEPKLPPAKDGRIPYIASSPLEAFKPGQYEIRAIVRQDGAAASEHTFVNVE
jgi:VWFA-related protein